MLENLKSLTNSRSGDYLDRLVSADRILCYRALRSNRDCNEFIVTQRYLHIEYLRLKPDITEDLNNYSWSFLNRSWPLGTGIHAFFLKVEELQEPQDLIKSYIEEVKPTVWKLIKSNDKSKLAT
jgi:hypothetical protein